MTLTPIAPLAKTQTFSKDINEPAGAFSVVPTDILKDIFSNIPLYPDGYKLFSVCKRFAAIAYAFFDPTIRNNMWFINACFKNHTATILRLLTDPRFNISHASQAIYHGITFACISSNITVVRAFLNHPRINLTLTKEIEPFFYACQHGQIEIVRELLKDNRIDPAARDNAAIKEACRKGYTEVIRELLKDERVDPSAEHNLSLVYAYRQNHGEILQLLLNHPKVALEEARLIKSTGENSLMRQHHLYNPERKKIEFGHYQGW